MHQQEYGLPNTLMFTIATEGYVPFVLNLHASLKRIGMGDELVVYSLDDQAQRQFSNAGILSLRYAADPCQQFSDYGTPGFTRTVSYKYTVALEILKAGKNAFYVDSDIVFLRNPVDYLHLVITQSAAHLVMQFESQKNVYNSGFWFARPARPVIELFSQIQASLHTMDFTCDQTLLNECLEQSDRITPYALDPKLFACGNQFLEGLPVEECPPDRSARPFAMDCAYMLHFNYLVGKDTKIRAMMKHRAVFALEMIIGSATEALGSVISSANCETLRSPDPKMASIERRLKSLARRVKQICVGRMSKIPTWLGGISLFLVGHGRRVPPVKSAQSDSLPVAPVTLLGSEDRILNHFRSYCNNLPEVVSEPFFVKVGANDGITGDPCSDILLGNPKWKGLLIEPVPYCFDRLKAHFRDTGRFCLEQVAIGEMTGEASFYYVDPKAIQSIPDLPAWFDQLGSFDKEHIMKHLDGVLEPFIIESKVQVRRLSDILSRDHIENVHLLHVDAEGSDYEVLKTVDFAKHAPLSIFVKHMHLAYGEKAAMLQLLRRHRYCVRDCGRDYFAFNNEAMQVLVSR